MKRITYYAVAALLGNLSIAFADAPVLQNGVQQFIDSLNKEGAKPIYTMTPTEARSVLADLQARIEDVYQIFN